MPTDITLTLTPDEIDFITSATNISAEVSDDETKYDLRDSIAEKIKAAQAAPRV